MDSILIGYIHYHFKMAYPFVCGSEAFFSLALVGFIIKSTNGFYLNHSSMKSDLYRAVIDAYVHTLMKQHCVLEVFLDEHRSRTGKINAPNEILFDQILKLHLKSNEHKDIKFVPVTINYDRVHDGESFPLELLGEQPQRDNLNKVIQHFIAINKPLGRVIIKYCEPISLNDYMKKHSEENGY